MADYKEIERSIIKKYRETIYRRFVRAIETYELIKENDRIMVCISGGKDKCIQEYKIHGPISFDVLYICMDPGYSKENRENIEKNASLLNIPLQIMDSDVFDVLDKVEHSCSLCARMRRGFLLNKAEELGCNKIALGHHFDDVVETTLLSMFYGSEVKTMLPKRKSDSHESIEIIRPLYMVKEVNIVKWQNDHQLHFIQCACRITKEVSGKRQEMKALLQRLNEVNPMISDHIFTSMHNVNLDGILGYTKNKEKKSFVELYKGDVNT